MDGRACREGGGGGRGRGLRRLSRDARRYFSWGALALFPSKKDAAAVLALCAGGAVFRAAARAFLGLKKLRGG